MYKLLLSQMKSAFKKFLIYIFITSPFFSIQAQQGLLFQNNKTEKQVLIKEGDLVKFSYKGYIGQRETKYGVLFSIQDSIIEIISPTAQGTISLGGTETRLIYIKDITGFRKFHKSRPYLMALSTISITIGSIYLYYFIDKKTNLNFGEKFGLSLGTGLVTTLIVKSIFPDRIKYKIGEAWSVEVLK